MALQLAKLALKIEKSYRSYRDIEWGFWNNNLYIFQSRPVTSGSGETDFEIDHEFDGPLRNENDYFALCNIGEVMPGATSPLGIEIIMKFFNIVFRKSNFVGFQQSDDTKYYPRGFQPWYNHMMFCTIDLFHDLNENPDKVQANSIGLFGRVLEDEELFSMAIERHRKSRSPKQYTFKENLKRLYRLLYGAKRTLDRAVRHYEKYNIPLSDFHDSQDLFNHLMYCCTDLTRAFNAHLTASESASVLNIYIFLILQKAEGEINADVYNDFAQLITTRDLECSDVPGGMERLALSIIAEKNQEDFKNMDLDDAQKWLETSSSNAGKTYREFLQRHGHRCLREFDVRSITWRNDPKSLIKTLQNLVLSVKKDKVEQKTREIRELIANLKVPLSLKNKLLLRIILPMSRRAVKFRELSKSTMMRGLYQWRQGYRKLAKLMVSEGRMPDEDLLYYMAFEEIKELLETRSPKILSKANHRRRRQPTLDKYIFPEIMKGFPVPVRIPVSTGTATGFVRVALDLDEASLLQTADEVFFYGVNSKSEYLITRIARGTNQEAEAWVYLKLSNGKIYQLQETSGRQQTGCDKRIFSCGGLQIHYLSPMRRWRIYFNGLLKETSEDGVSSNKKVHVKFALLWRASTDPFDFRTDVNIKALTSSIARAKWNQCKPPLEKLLKALDFYAQCGIIMGTVSIDGNDEQDLYLFGERIRFTGDLSLKGMEFFHVLGHTTKNGRFVHVVEVSMENVVEKLIFGFATILTGALRPIQDKKCRLEMLVDEERNERDIEAKFRARDKLYHLKGILPGMQHNFKNTVGWNGHLSIDCLDFELNLQEGKKSKYPKNKEFNSLTGGQTGKGIVIMGKMMKPLRKSINNRPSLTTQPGEDTARSSYVAFTSEVVPCVLVTHFSEKTCQNPEISGGKGSSLGKLTELSKELQNFVVPKGIVVTTSAYELFVTDDILNEIKNLENVLYQDKAEETKIACQRLMAEVIKTSIPDEIRQSFVMNFQNAFPGGRHDDKFAIRSSATGEDTEQMSAAGQMETYLGVAGISEILAAIKKCWASQFSYIAVQYKRQNGQMINSPMAVVVQEMIPCDNAGVLFTCDPLTGNPTTMAITANYGLGESVVSGSEEPDTIEIERLDEDNLTIKNKIIGSKGHKIVLKDDGGTVIEDVSENEQHSCSLSDNLALLLGHVAIKKTGPTVSLPNILEKARKFMDITGGKRCYKVHTTVNKSKKPPTLLLYPMKSAEKEEVLEILKREIARPSTKIKDVQKIKNKGVAVQLERDQDVEELIQAINSKETLKSTIETKKPGKRHPSIIIYNLPDETTEDEVQEALAINADIKERLNIRFKLSGRQRGTAHWILETPSESFHKLKRLGKLPIHWTMHQVREFFHIKRCNNCQGFRHLAKDCPSNRPSCGSCAGHHPTRKCRSPQVVCINCVMHNQFHGTRFPAYHHTSDSGCSCYLGKFRLQKNSNLPWSTSSTTTTAIDVIQINLAKSKVATAHLEKLASEININHFLVQEPYVKEGKIAGVPRKWHQCLSSNNKAGIISLPSTNNPIFICSTTNLTAIKIQTITGPVNLISAYSSPYAELQDTAQDLANLLTKIGPEQALIGADMNAPSTLWGYANNSPRGNIMEDLISGLNLHLLNEKNSEPTFQRRNAKGWPDLTLVKGVQLARTASWKVRDELSSSDHKYIHTQLGISVQNHTYTRFKTAYGGHRKFSMHFKKEIPQIQQQLHDCNTREQLDETTSLLQRAIFRCCQKAYKLKKVKQSTKVTWWTQELDIKKKEMRAVQKRVNNTTGMEQTRYQLLFSRKQALYKKLSLRAKRTFLKNFCTQTKNPYGIPYKAIVKDNLPPSDFFKIMDQPEEGDSLSFANRILQELYPQIPTPFQRQPQNQTAREEAFTKNEIARIMQKVPIKKAPGYDGIDFIVLKTIFRTNPDILITFYNKCLSLQCFPNPLKTGVIVLFFNKGKNKSDIKSYRPVSLLPTLGKILEKLLLERLNHHLRRNNLQHPNQYGFRTNRSTEEAILDLLDKINSAKNSNQHALMISLDIKGAFDHLQYTSIKNSLDNLKYHSNTLETLTDILSNRKVAINTSQGPATWNQQQGYPLSRFLEPGSRRSAPARLASRGAPAGICR
ncbi:Putative phosphoenolpyruvate synthase [Araneus ventricosus]|uniref:Phosphoenolpyruvate synthase n=1 Tax=Araneus ventricosus TaxID=182803 RepID=A0A4Y2ETY4_ARAVE|nr:Putative phosphoenolpyruvate synthase [Araneus ventricosus]